MGPGYDFQKKWNPALHSKYSNTKSDVVMGPMGKILVTHRAINNKQKIGFGANFGCVLDLERTMFPTSDSKMQNIKFYNIKLLQQKKGGGYYQIIDFLHFRDFFWLSKYI